MATLEQVEARVNQLATQLQAGADRISALEQQFSNGSGRITALEQAGAVLNQKANAGAVRLGELESAALAFNQRMQTIEGRLSTLENAEPSDLSGVLARLDAIEARLVRVEQQRAQGGTLSGRLASIESKLDELLDTNQPTIPDPTD